MKRILSILLHRNTTKKQLIFTKWKVNPQCSFQLANITYYSQSQKLLLKVAELNTQKAEGDLLGAIKVFPFTMRIIPIDL